jgi:hypothetical protein
VWANQFDNLANRRAHYATTGPEIWEQTGGRVDAWVAATGTGGTYAGVALFLKERNPAIRCVLADPHGSALYAWAKTGELASEGNSITEGIGNSRITANLEGVIVTLLCDSGLRYRQRLFNRDFLKSKGLEMPSWLRFCRRAKRGQHLLVHQVDQKVLTPFSRPSGAALGEAAP